MGYCGYGSFRDALSSISDPNSAVSNKEPPSGPALQQVTLLAETYMDPSLVAKQCAPYLATDIGMLFALGGAFRLATYLYLAYKGSRR